MRHGNVIDFDTGALETWQKIQKLAANRLYRMEVNYNLREGCFEMENGKKRFLAVVLAFVLSLDMVTPVFAAAFIGH